MQQESTDILNFECESSIIFPETYARIIAILYGPISASDFEKAVLSLQSPYQRSAILREFAGSLQLVSEDNLKNCIADMQNGYDKEGFLEKFYCDFCRKEPKLKDSDGDLEVCNCRNHKGELNRFRCIYFQKTYSSKRKCMINADGLLTDYLRNLMKDSQKLAALERLQSLIYVTSETDFTKHFKEPGLADKAKSLFNGASTYDEVAKRIVVYNVELGKKYPWLYARASNHGLLR
jgi:hypothetical protein